MISIIVPVYNTEKYLKKCIDSILSQTYKDFEVIIINDCSPDNSDEIIKGYKDKRIKYIKNKKNKGIGYNRNLGLSEARGEYVCFIDSDDYVREDFLELMYKKCSDDDLDLCICDYSYVDDAGNFNPVKLENFDNTNLSDNPKLLVDIPLGPCNKMYRKSMIDRGKIKFSETLKYEDVSFVASALFHSKRIGKIDDALNIFSVHERSETSTRDARVFDIFKQLDMVRELYCNEKNGYLDELIVSIIFNYTIQERYQSDNKIISQFIDDAFRYLDNNDIDYKNSMYIKNRPFYKSFIEKSKLRTKIYCYLYKTFRF